MTMRYLTDEPLTAWPSTIAACHVCRGAGFVNKYKPFRIESGLSSAPCLTRDGDVRPVLFRRVQTFFYR
jgi:hypothetical protein